MSAECRELIDRKFHSIFHFEYGVLDEQTFWISSGREKVLRINKFTFSVLMDINTGRSMREVAKKYDVSDAEILETYRLLERNGFVVTEHFGKMKRVTAGEDIELTGYLLVLFFLAACQFFYFNVVAKTILMSKTREGILVAAVALVAIIFHEYGHYFFFTKYTGRKTRIKFDLLKMVPSVYVDTNFSWRLPKNMRIMINLGGLLFDMILNALVVGLVLAQPAFEYYATPFLLTQYLRISVLINPLFKGDGYWLLSDLTGVVNMEKSGFQALIKGKVNLLSFYGLISVIFSLVTFLGFAWFVVNLARPYLTKFLIPLFQ